MKLLLDHNLSPRLAKKLDPFFEKIVHVDWLNMSEASDTSIWDYVAENLFVITTKDRDFLDRSSLKGHPPKVIHLRLGNCTVREIFEVLADHSSQINAFVKQTSRSYMLLP